MTTNDYVYFHYWSNLNIWGHYLKDRNDCYLLNCCCITFKGRGKLFFYFYQSIPRHTSWFSMYLLKILLKFVLLLGVLNFHCVKFTWISNSQGINFSKGINVDGLQFFSPVSEILKYRNNCNFGVQPLSFRQFRLLMTDDLIYDIRSAFRYLHVAK